MADTLLTEPQIREGFHGTPHPRAGSMRVLDTPQFAGKAVKVLDWYDRVTGQSWKEAALGGDPVASAYARYLARHGLADTPQAVLVEFRCERYLVPAHDLS